MFAVLFRQILPLSFPCSGGCRLGVVVQSTRVQESLSVRLCPTQISWRLPPLWDGRVPGLCLASSGLLPCQRCSVGCSLRISYLHGAHDTHVGVKTDSILSLHHLEMPQLGGDPEAHVAWSSELCLPPQVIMLNYT